MLYFSATGEPAAQTASETARVSGPCSQNEPSPDLACQCEKRRYLKASAAFRKLLPGMREGGALEIRINSA
jgi:hypothetical protein